MRFGGSERARSRRWAGHAGIRYQAFVFVQPRASRERETLSRIGRILIAQSGFELDSGSCEVCECDRRFKRCDDPRRQCSNFEAAIAAVQCATSSGAMGPSGVSLAS